MGLVQGIGINDMPRGWLSANKENRRIYDTWYDMIKRSYNNKLHESYPTYKGCEVAEEWLRLSRFVEDIEKIPGYNDWVSSPNSRWALDKDIRYPGNKLYSLDTVCFVSMQINNLEKCIRNQLYDVEVIDKSGNVVFRARGLDAISKFVGRSKQSCSDVIQGRSKTVGGFILRKV